MCVGNDVKTLQTKDPIPKQSENHPKADPAGKQMWDGPIDVLLKCLNRKLAYRIGRDDSFTRPPIGCRIL